MEYTRLIALPESFDPAFNSEFEDWCEGQGIVARFTRVGAAVPLFHTIQPSLVIKQFNFGYQLWKIIGTDRAHVAVKLRWCNEMAPDGWVILKIERDFAEASGETLDYPPL